MLTLPFASHLTSLFEAYYFAQATHSAVTCITDRGSTFIAIEQALSATPSVGYKLQPCSKAGH